MGGIAGIIDPQLGRAEGETLLARMLDSIRHRGPDDSARWIDPPVLLGQNRLGTDGGENAEPTIRYRGLVMVCDGEVYNSPEIKSELTRKGHRFTSDSVTEVLLAAYEEWGGACVERFVGMWAFAIWDSIKRELFCSRDRFGIKPLYYIHSGDKFYFGSEYKPLKMSPWFRSALNLRHLTRAKACYRDETYFECLKALPERSNLVFTQGKIRVCRYWDVDGSRKSSAPFDEKKKRFFELFRGSMRLHMRGDAAIGGLLSGGLDSTSIASVVGTDFSSVPFKTFTIHYTGHDQMDERPWVSEVAAAYGNLRPVFYQPSDEEVGECFAAVVKANDTPLMGPLPVSGYFAMRTAARNGVNVVLDGTGSDSYLPGDATAVSRHIAGRMRALRFFSSFRAAREFASADPSHMAGPRFWLRTVRAALASEQSLRRGQHRRLLPLAADADAPFTPEKIPGSQLDQYLYHLLMTTFLPSILHYADRMSAACSVECRLPFLDHRLVEFAFSLRDEDRLRNGQTKYILREALESILPKPIRARKDKQRFVGGEMAKWLRGPLAHLLSPASFDGFGLIDERRARRVLREFQAGNDRMRWLVWRLGNLHYWASRQ